MIKTLKTIALAIASMAMTVAIQAQDLSSQRGESQNLGGLFGEKLDHGGIIINPTPQQIYMLRTIGVDINAGVALKGTAKEFASEVEFLKHNKLGVRNVLRAGWLGFDIPYR